VGRGITRLWGIAVAVAVPALLVPAGANAIIGGRKDGSAHPNVGLIAALNAKGDVIDACTGTLVAPKVVMTAAHCVGGKKLGLVDRYVVSFKPVAIIGGKVDGAIGGQPTPNWRFNLQLDPNAGAAAVDRNAQYDVGVLVLNRRADAVYPGIKPAVLPAKGALDKYRTATTKPTMTHVGYGVPRSLVFDGIRRTVNSPLSKLTDTLLFTRGGICLGDSGGPVFDAKGVVVSVASFIDGQTCSSAAGGPRLDIDTTRSFLRKFGVS
jgi:V8-like Glu-specific endopeptidase